MIQFVKALAAMGINYHSSFDREWAVINDAGTDSQTVTVFTNGNEHIDFNFNANGDFTYIFVGETEDGENEETCSCCGAKQTDPTVEASSAPTNQPNRESGVIEGEVVAESN